MNVGVGVGCKLGVRIIIQSEGTAGIEEDKRKRWDGFANTSCIAEPESYKIFISNFLSSEECGAKSIMPERIGQLLEKSKFFVVISVVGASD
ncbi:hypothetical protein ACFX1S_022544 [Malus domestica]